MINKLTKEQEKQIPKYIDKWVKVASTPTNRKKATDVVRKMYSAMGEKPPIVVFGFSPIFTALMCSLFFLVFKKGDSQLDSQLYGQLDSQLYDQLDSQLYSQLDSQLRSQLDSQLRSQLYSQLDSINNEWYLVIFWLLWCGWYDFGKYIGVKFDIKAFNLFIEFCSNVSFIIPYQGIAFVSETPKISWSNGQLHNPNGKAVEYEDGWGLYCLNGVSVPKEVVMTPACELDPKLILTTKNAAVRREIVRKIGIERVVSELGGKCLDKWADYELLQLSIPDMNIKPTYLKMKNPSIGVYHLEGVPSGVTTCLDALRWRCHDREWKPEQLT